MKTFFNLFKKDMVIALRNALVWVLMGTLVLLVVSVKFLIPEDFQQDQAQYIYDNSQGKVLQQIHLQMKEADNLVASREALDQALEDNPYSIGIVYEGTIENPKFTIIHQSQIDPRRQKLIDASLGALVKGIRGVQDEGEYQVKYIRPPGEVIAKNKTAVAALLTFEVLILGFLFIAVFMFQEKNEGSLRAYRISPSGISQYIFSKVSVFLVIGLIYGISFVLLTLGVSVDFVNLSILIILGVTLYTLLGMIVAVYFNNISDWFFAGMGILILNMLPIISYGFPVFAPKWITWIPSYPIIFAFSEVLFPTGRTFASLILMLALGNIVVYGACHLVVESRLMKEGR
ncbi:ABC transporter permease [Alkaliphilus hydrothermalis]|uniref:ABC-2 type transport system permease protein/fluoroquinolone transport system permease protein n=1 Tax=Alkaliphilus hydrothermalis TaxID=1482730 RepID=A0ABS2NNH9_9FIRM|nr:ABC transporter permease [Alkaliphilus hydrothermalis]MBM7614464.1 ABC-2 type transport system permease protein/fluoroquinolone transport system permease protein [Alkaliphilus hydrothermalis]